MGKYIFVTGGVVSGIGKGITAASLGLLLKTSGKTVDVIKFDPYLNIDPGTMSPFEHGEVFVLADGSETDLDLGHYERFLDVDLTGLSSVTAGKIYSQILEKERAGDYLGKNVQLIPNVTTYIKRCFEKNFTKDVRIIEIGGSTGDMEGEIFLESFRQFKRQKPNDVFHVHLGYVPFLACSGEYKTKPMQMSLRELLRVGLQPDMIVVRSESTKKRPIEQSQLNKIALFSNLRPENIASLPDQSSIYEVPQYLLNYTDTVENLSDFVGEKIVPKLPDFYIDYTKPRSPIVKICLVTKYTKLSDSYLSVIEALKSAAVYYGAFVEVDLIDAEREDLLIELQKYDGVIVPGGFGSRGMEGKIKAIEYIRKNQKPFLGICLGLQLAAIEYARNVCGLDAYTREMFEDETEALSHEQVIIDYLPGQHKIMKKGGTMRLGEYKCKIKSGTLASSLYKEKSVLERHRHRLEVQNKWVSELEEKGLIVSGEFEYIDEKSGKKDYLVEMIEIGSKQHPYFIATQAHPELKSRPNSPHPLFLGLIKSALDGFEKK
jgi:CTP synthase